MTQTLGKQKLLGIGSNPEQIRQLAEQLGDRFEVFNSATLMAGIESLAHGDVAGLILLGDQLSSTGQLLQAGGLLEHLPSGIALLGEHRDVLWHNARFKQLAGGGTDSFIGRSLYQCFGSVEILGPDFCPLNTAYATGESARSTLRVGDKSYFEVEATPVFDDSMEVLHFLAVVVRDTSAEVLQRQKISAIYQAGLELSDLTPQELLEMTVEDRIDLLKSKILHFTQDLLEYNTVEVRVLDRSNNQLDPLLSIGMNEAAEQRILHADPQKNGVTGFVASTGKSYLCEDTLTDPLYLEGSPSARSSLTVPLIWHEEVLGTFNVESPRAGAFTENDLQFLELFAREIAMALNTLQLLAVEKLSTASQSAEKILCEVGQPVDDIIHSVTWVIENTIGVDREISDRLRDILKSTRDIKQQIQQVGDTLRPKGGKASLVQSKVRPKMQHKRVMVVDADEEVRRAAHELLERFGCEVETAPDAETCFLMARSYHYDAVIVDIRLPDHDGFATYSRLMLIDPNLAVILMTGYGYDPSHSIPNAKQAGLTTGVLYKPFRIDQLVKELEKVFSLPTELV